MSKSKSSKNIFNAFLNKKSMPDNQDAFKDATLDVHFLIPNPRNTYSMTDIDDLATRIHLYHFIEPLLVRPIEGDLEHYMVLSGHRRREAVLKCLEIDPSFSPMVPVRIIDFNKTGIADEYGLSPEEMDTIFIHIPNSQRVITNKDFLDRVEMMKPIVRKVWEKAKEEGTSHGGFRAIMADMLHESESKVERALLLSGLDESLKSELENNNLSITAASSIAGLPKEEQVEIYNRILSSGEKVTVAAIANERKRKKEEQEAAKKKEKENLNAEAENTDEPSDTPATDEIPDNNAPSESIEVVHDEQPSTDEEEPEIAENDDDNEDIEVIDEDNEPEASDNKAHEEENVEEADEPQDVPDEDEEGAQVVEFEDYFGKSLPASNTDDRDNNVNSEDISDEESSLSEETLSKMHTYYTSTKLRIESSSDVKNVVESLEIFNQNIASLLSSVKQKADA